MALLAVSIYRGQYVGVIYFPQLHCTVVPYCKYWTVILYNIVTCIIVYIILYITILGCTVVLVSVLKILYCSVLYSSIRLSALFNVHGKRAQSNSHYKVPCTLRIEDYVPHTMDQVQENVCCV